jgi:hypothetical protein
MESAQTDVRTLDEKITGYGRKKINPKKTANAIMRKNRIPSVRKDGSFSTGKNKKLSTEEFRANQKMAGIKKASPIHKVHGWSAWEIKNWPKAAINAAEKRFLKAAERKKGMAFKPL